MDMSTYGVLFISILVSSPPYHLLNSVQKEYPKNNIIHADSLYMKSKIESQLHNKDTLNVKWYCSGIGFYWRIITETLQQEETVHQKTLHQ